MGMTPQEFFTKNMKWIVMILSLLFVIKSIQSCNRGMALDTLDKTNVEYVDSISSMYEGILAEKDVNINTLTIELTECRYEVKLANAQADGANKRADAVQSTAEKTRSNTTSTIVVKGAEEVEDTVKINE